MAQAANGVNQPIDAQRKGTDDQAFKKDTSLQAQFLASLAKDKARASLEMQIYFLEEQQVIAIK